MGRKKQEIKLTEAHLLGLMMRESPLAWLTEAKVQLSAGVPYQLDGHKYQVEPLISRHQRVCAKKGAQVGWTLIEVLKTVHGLIYGRYPQGVMYLFPTGDDVTDFSKSRFNPLIDVNRCIQAHVKNTDSATIKQIGPGFLYLRGGRSTSRIGGSKESSTKLKSVPVDKVVFDECDEISQAMIQLALERFSHSRVQEEVYLSTPTIPDYGIDALYQGSDQRLWMIVCKKCNAETCLEVEFPECVKLRDDGSAFRACRKCGQEIFPKDGKWVAQYPDRTQDMAGYWISQLNSDYIDPGKVLELYQNPPNGNLAEVMNSKLGMAYIDAENRLSVAEVLSCCTADPMKAGDEGPTAMGVDVGKDLHVVVARRKTKVSLEVLKVVRLGDFNQLHDLAKAFNCRAMVIDKYPETHKVRDFQKAEPYAVWLCSYQEAKRSGGTAWDTKLMEIHGNRTELLDGSHSIVKEPGRLVLPRVNDEIKVFASQMTNVAKVLEDDTATGGRIYKYKKVGASGDHYRHAMTYCMLAAQRVSVHSSKRLIDRFWTSRQVDGRSWMTA